MKRTGLIALLAVATVLLLVAYARVCVAPYMMPVVGGGERVETMSQSFQGIRRINVANESGMIKIRPANTDDVHVTATYRARPLTRAAADLLAMPASLQTFSKAQGELLEITSPSMGQSETEILIDYLIEAPKGTEIAVDNVNGNVDMAGEFGAVRLSGQNTDMEVTSPRGPVTVHTVNGRVRLTDAAHGADIATMNGNVYAQVTGGSLHAKTSNGVIVARVASVDVSDVDLTTLNGGITVVLNEGCSARLDARTQHGKVRTDWPVDTSNGGAKGLQQIVGVVGSGQTPIRVDTVNGNVWIARDGL